MPVAGTHVTGMPELATCYRLAQRKIARVLFLTLDFHKSEYMQTVPLYWLTSKISTNHWHLLTQPLWSYWNEDLRIPKLISNLLLIGDTTTLDIYNEVTKENYTSYLTYYDPKTKYCSDETTKTALRENWRRNRNASCWTMSSWWMSFTFIENYMHLVFTSIDCTGMTVQWHESMWDILIFDYTAVSSSLI